MTIWALVACTPEPAPSPTPTGFASEDEAFRAAETTYRSYIDALNNVDLSDPATFEPLFELTTGQANEDARKEFSQMHADGWVVAGKSSVTLVQPSGDWAPTRVTLSVCVDVGSVTLVDSAGNSVVNPERQDVQSMSVDLKTIDRTTEWAISRFAGRSGEPECAAR